MVRLKVSTISAILSANFEISIPYGAIKSVTILLSVFCSIAFQFLMVRLKENPLKRALYLSSNFNSLWCD